MSTPSARAFGFADRDGHESVPALREYLKLNDHLLQDFGTARVHLRNDR